MDKNRPQTSSYNLIIYLAFTLEYCYNLILEESFKETHEKSVRKIDNKMWA